MAEKKNISSGAEKAEKLALANKDSKSKSKSQSKGKKSTVKSTPKKSKKTGNVVKSKQSNKSKKTSEKRALRQKRHEEKRAQRAQINAERKQKRLERKLAHKEHKEERAAALKAKREERKEKRLELKEARIQRRQELKNESKEARRERIAEERQAKREARAAKREAYLQEKRAKREHALKVRAEKRAARSQKNRTPGFGGWLAAVITLGVTTLGLATVVTFGWLTMNDMQVDMASGYTQSLYELNAIVDDLDTDLARAQASNSASDRVRVLSNIAVESRTAETVLERFPIDTQLTEQITSFVNRMGDSARDMLYTVANGGELTPSQIKTLEYMYENNKKLKEQINELAATCDGNDMLCAMRGKDSKLADGFSDIQNSTFSVPEGIEDGAFAAVEKISAEYVKNLDEITAQTAEQLASDYFKSYKVKEAKCTGEVVAEALTLYNVNLKTQDGNMLVQLSKNGGKVVAFDSYKYCSDKNFSIENCIDIAEDFLESIGYGHLEAVFSSENGTTCHLTFAPVENGTVIYSDKVLVKVCEQRGIVTGVEAIDYVLNHAERNISGAQITSAQAKESINGNLEVSSTRKVVIPMNGSEVLCYEFVGTLGGNTYYVYVDAVTGEEVEVLTVVGTAQGRILK